MDLTLLSFVVVVSLHNSLIVKILLLNLDKKLLDESVIVMFDIL
jgi:hypothetical protein